MIFYDHQHMNMFMYNTVELFLTHYVGFLARFQDHLGQQTKINEESYDDGSLYLIHIQVLIERDCEKGPTPWKEFKGIQVCDLFHSSCSISIKVMTSTKFTIDVVLSQTISKDKEEALS